MYLENYIIDKSKCKTFNQKLQWIKLYSITDLMRDCTDKVKVRDYVKDKIGEEYLKPVIQIVRNEELEVRNNNLTSNFSLLTPNLFNKINWKELPNSFILKCNHGCKWQYIIEDKKLLLENKCLFEDVYNNLPKINYFKKYGHLCASRCGIECIYCYNCAKKIQKIYEIKLKEREKQPHYVAACKMT